MKLLLIVLALIAVAMSGALVLVVISASNWEKDEERK